MRSSSGILLCQACSRQGLRSARMRSLPARERFANQTVGQIRRTSGTSPQFDTRGAHLLLPVGVAGVAGGVFLFGYWYTQEREKGSHGKSQGSLHPDRYRPLKVIRSDLSTSLMMPDQRGDGLHRHIKLALDSLPDAVAVTNSMDASSRENESMRIDSIYIKQPDIQIERAYTPLLSRAQSEHSGCLDLLVKRYEDGEMGRYIQSIPVGGTLECRGWDTTWDSKWHPDKDIKHIYMLVAGTGITPAFQLVASQLSKLPENSKLTVLYAAPQPASFLLLPELSTLQKTYADQLSVSLWAEDASSVKARPSVLWPWPTVPHEWQDLPLSEGRISLTDVKRNIQKEAGSIILVCGPEGFVAAMAGPRSRDGRLQGPLQGLLAEAGFEASQVFKL